MKFSRRLRHLFRRRASEAEMAEEMQFHLEQRAADYAERGLAADEARHAAQRKFGNVGSIREEARDTFGWGGLERAWQDVRFAARDLARSPGFALLAVLTLALGIGANSAMFACLNSMLLRPLPYPQSERLDRIDRATPQNPEGRMSAADFFDFQRVAANGYGEVAANALGDVSLTDPGQPPEIVPALRVTANYFTVLRTPPQLGREFRVEEQQPGNDRVLIISERCWLNRFGGRKDIIGHTVRVDGNPHVIIGVLPANAVDFRYLGWVDIFRPLALDARQLADRRTQLLRMTGRRADGLTRTQAWGFAANFGTQLAQDYPAVNAGSAWRPIPLNRGIAGSDGPVILSMLTGLSGFVLLIACSNLANLLLARTMARAREFAVRAALGASRLQLLRPLVAEALVLSLAGGALALVVAQWAGDWLSLRSTDDYGQRFLLTFDWKFLGWTCGASLLTAVAFGIAPALFAMRIDVNDTLKSGARGATGGRAHRRFRQLLIVAQFGLAMVLLAGAGLFVRGLDELNHRRAGWESAQLVTGTIVLPAGAYPDAEKMATFQRLALERLQALPGVASASLASFTPFFNWGDVRKYVVQGRAIPVAGREPVANVNSVTPGYFETVGTRLNAGRAFDERDNAAAGRVFIINQTMAATLFPNESPLGRRIARAGLEQPQWGEIVGVVADAKSTVADANPVTFQVYQPLAQEPRPQNEIIVRAGADVAPATLVDRVRGAITQLDADLPVRQLQPADTTIARRNYQLAVLRDILSAFALLGLALAALGVYGVIARTTAQRTSEFAIRLALGACVRDITCLVLRSGVKLALVGAAFGLFGALGLARGLAFGFPGMQLSSPPVLVGTTLLLIVVALLACWLPARRAGRVNAMVSLRAE